MATSVALALTALLAPPACLSATSAAAVTAPLEARPGSVVRWSGAATQRCGRGERSWPAVAQTCWFAIDLLEPEGEMEVHRWRDGRRETASIRVTGYPYPVQRLTITDSSKVDLSAQDLARVRKEQARVGALWGLDSPVRFALPLTPPLEDLGSGGSFGSRRFFNGQPRSPHSGADYAASEGVTVFSVAPGRVVLAADLFFSGRSVFIDHGGGLISMYFHLSSIDVAEGEQVESRAVVGSVGQTGRATGPHLHFGLRWRGARVDPSLLLGAVEAIPDLQGRMAGSEP